MPYPAPRQPGDHAPDITRPGARLDGRQAARVRIALLCHQMADHVAVHGIPTTGDAHRHPGDWISLAVRINHMRLELLHICVTIERMRGTTWGAIADRLGLPEDAATAQFGHCDLSHLADCGQQVWSILTRTCVAPTPDPPTPEAAAAELDEWYASWAHPGEAPAPPAHAVTANL